MQSEMGLPSIEAIQKSIIKEFALLGGDRELMLDYIVDLGKKMPLLPVVAKTRANLVPGCLSKVWLVQEENERRLFLEADSNTAITKGLVSLLVRVFSGQRLKAILEADFFLLRAIGMGQLIGAQRGSGFDGMLAQVRQYAKHCYELKGGG